MPSIIAFFQSKFSDKNIRIIRAVYALIFAGVLYIGRYDLVPQWGLPPYSWYILALFPAVSLVRAVLDPGICRRKIWKWTQVGVGIYLVFVGWWVLENRDIPSVSTLGTGTIQVDAAPVPTVDVSAGYINADMYIALLGWICMFGGLLFASKNITTKNERYGEKVTKIRV
jgi:hypothetical protein